MAHLLERFSFRSRASRRGRAFSKSAFPRFSVSTESKNALIGLLLSLSAPQVPRAPYVATPPDVVDKMLKLASVSSNDVVYDLGCGDGRIVIAAAQQFGARGVGVDIDPARIAEARRNAAQAQVEDLVTFRLEDALNTDVSEATVVTLYLLSAQNVALERFSIRWRPKNAGKRFSKKARPLREALDRNEKRSKTDARQTTSSRRAHRVAQLWDGRLGGR